MDSLDELFAAALAARGKAYAPYSRFPVGAAVRTASGTVHAGCNVENAAYPVGVCAETSAISAMVLAGDSRIAEIVVVGGGPQALTPCGACRQRISEFASADTKVHCANLEGIKATYRLDELLPHAFRPSVLRKT